MMPRARSLARKHRTRESGLTLMELLVSLAVLGIIGGVVGTAFSVGLIALGKGGAGERVTGAGDQARFEQLLGQDVTRAACVQAPGLGPYGSCSAGFRNAPITSTCSAASLCVAWPENASATWSCHVAAYTPLS